MTFSTCDQGYMDEALEQAELAARRGEVPVGAVIVDGGEVVARASNRMRLRHDPTAHAEVVALRRAGRRLGNYRLTGATLYATLEPCVMCFGAAVHARIARLVYACDDPKAGARTSGAVSGVGLNHRFELVGGLAAERSSELLKDFFERRRSTAPASARHGDDNQGEVPKWS